MICAKEIEASYHAETILAAISPGLTDRLAEVNSSADPLLVPEYLLKTQERPIINREKKNPIPNVTP